MTGWDSIFYLFLNAFRIYIIYRFIGLFFEDNAKRAWAPCLYFLFYLFNSLEYIFINIDIVNLSVNFVGLLLITLIGYRGSIIRKILAVVLNLGIGVLAENLAWVLFVKGKPPQMESYGIFFFTFVLFLLELLIERTVKLRKGIEVPLNKNIFLALISLGSMFVANVLIESSYRKVPWLIASLCILLIINLFVLYLYEKILDDYVNLKEKEMYSLQLTMYQNQLKIMESVNDTYDRLRHDMKHHIVMLSDYIKNRENEEALQYLSKITHYMGSSKQYIETGNRSIDSILNYIIEEIYRSGGSVITDIKLAANIPIDDFDINIILSNLLMNACEAIQKCDEKRLEIIMRYNRGILSFKFINTYDGLIKEKRGKLQSTKERSENHGIGLTSVKKTIEKYNGEMQFQYTGNLFEADVLLYISDEENE